MAKRKIQRKVVVNGKVYRATVLLIHTTDKHGRPQLLKLIGDDQSIELAGGEEFMMVYAPNEMVKPRSDAGCSLS